MTTSLTTAANESVSVEIGGMAIGLRTHDHSFAGR